PPPRSARDPRDMSHDTTLTWGPRHGPHTPSARHAPAKPRRSSIPLEHGSPDMAPMPPALVTPRRSRGAPRYHLNMGAPTWPPYPSARPTPAKPGRSS